MVRPGHNQHHNHDRCQSCAAELKHRLYCDSCEKLQQLGKGDDYFTIFGHPRRFVIEEPVVEAAFDELLLALHPDLHATAEPQEQALSVEHTALLMEAKQALFNPYLRGKYLLSLLAPDLGSAVSKPPQGFLVQTFELQEALDQAEAGKAPLGPTQTDILALQKALEAELNGQFDRLTEDADQPELVKEIQSGLGKLKFLLNLKERAQELAKKLS